VALDEHFDNVVQLPKRLPTTEDLEALTEANAARQQELGVGLDPIAMLAMRINIVLSALASVHGDEFVRQVELTFQHVVKNTLDAAEAEMVKQKAAQLLVPNPSLVVPDITGADVKGDRNSHIRRINDTWGE